MRLHSRCGIALLLATALTGGEAEGEATNLTYIGNLTAEFHQDEPLSLDDGGRVTLRFVNRTGGVAGMASIQMPLAGFPAVVWTLAPKPKPDALDPEVWGPEIDSMLSTNLDAVTDSRQLPRWKPPRGKDRIDPAWRALRTLGKERETLALMPKEGYATMLAFAPHWIASGDLLRAKAQRRLGLQSGPIFDLLVPATTADAVSPGKPIVWGERTPECTVPKLRAIRIRDGTANAARDPLAEPGPAVLTVEADGPLAKTRDLPLTYLVGNVGSVPLWVWQNSLGPATVSWTLLRQDRTLAQGDGAAYQSLTQLLPSRPAFPLLPGEFLSWKFTIPASALAVQAPGSGYRLRLQVTGSTASTSQRPDGPPKPTVLSAELPLVAE